MFLNRFLKAAKVGECDQTTEKLCEYLCELTLQEYTFIKYRPSEIAAAALRLALHTMRLPSWSPLLQEVSGCAAALLTARARALPRRPIDFSCRLTGSPLCAQLLDREAAELRRGDFCRLPEGRVEQLAGGPGEVRSRQIPLRLHADPS